MSEDPMTTALDEYIAPGLRLWMLIGLIAGIMLVMVVIVCCFMRIRIPRTKRQIDLIAAKRKMRKQASLSTSSGHDERNVNMNSLPRNASTSPRSAEKSDSSQPLVHQSASDTTHKTTSV